MTAPTEPKNSPAATSSRPRAGPKSERTKTAEIIGEQAAKLSESSRTSATNFMHDLSSAAETGGEALKRQGHEYTADVLDRVAAELEGLAGKLKQKTGGEIARELQSLAHRRPALFFGGALLVGFGLSRFLKSTEQNAGSQAASSTQSHETQITNR